MLDFTPFTPGSTITPHIVGVGFRDMVYTDGMQYLVNETGALWIIHSLAYSIPQSRAVLGLLEAALPVTVTMTMADHEDTARINFEGSRSGPIMLVYRQEFGDNRFPFEDLPDTTDRGTLPMMIQNTRDGFLIGLAQEF